MGTELPDCLRDIEIKDCSEKAIGERIEEVPNVVSRLFQTIIQGCVREDYVLSYEMTGPNRCDVYLKRS
jgi:hypothetical protein